MQKMADRELQEKISNIFKVPVVPGVWANSPMNKALLCASNIIQNNPIKTRADLLKILNFFCPYCKPCIWGAFFSE